MDFFKSFQVEQFESFVRRTCGDPGSIRRKSHGKYELYKLINLRDDKSKKITLMEIVESFHLLSCFKFRELHAFILWTGRYQLSIRWKVHGSNRNFVKIKLSWEQILIR